MKKFVMLEIAVEVNTNLENANDIVDNLNIKIEGNGVVEVAGKMVENSYTFEA